MNAVDWIIERFKEPSSYAAAGGAIVGIGVLISQPVVIIVGIVGGALGFVLKEKGVI
jgi:4-amino-4-deoxy-L-arabinose transferase-like glycosyltransferase|tara:strand:- start:3895 stop:4065 length:171 start_codon:yes stop_codon:yes gene_type:complete